MKQLKWIFPLITSMLFMTACSHEDNTDLDESSTINEEILKNYPKEITIDNWEQFVHAPKEVLQHFVAKEKREIRNRTDVLKKVSLNTTITSTLEFGQIQVQTKGVNLNTAWLGNTGVSTFEASDLMNPIGTNPVSVNYDYGNNSNYFFTRSEEDTDLICLFYEDVRDGEFTNAQWRNGVSTLDIVFISRHLIGLECFTEIWQYLAADVNGDGIVSTLDMVELQKLILYITNEMPVLQGNNYNQPVIYFPQSDYDGMQAIRDLDGCNGFDESALFGFYSIVSCQSVSDEIDRYAIKRGDVSGNWSY